jgi:hypothetical protein
MVLLIELLIKKYIKLSCIMFKVHYLIDKN